MLQWQGIDDSQRIVNLSYEKGQLQTGLSSRHLKESKDD